MNKKILMFAVVLLSLAMLATPVLAIGPWQALEVGNNPNLYLPEDSPFDNVAVRVRTPSGTINFWQADVSQDLFNHQIWLDASKAKIGNAVVVPEFDPNANPFTQLLVQILVDPEISQAYEQKWLYLSFHNVISFLVILGTPLEEAVATATIHTPKGVYYMYMAVGN
jgi:hypothetical protein